MLLDLDPERKRKGKRGDTRGHTFVATSWSEVKSFSRVRLFATPWTVAYQAPPSMGFSSKSAGVDCYFLLQGIFPTQESNLGLPHCWQTLYRLSHQGSPTSCEGGNTDEMSDQADDEKNWCRHSLIMKSFLVWGQSAKRFLLKWLTHSPLMFALSLWPCELILM